MQVLEQVKPVLIIVDSIQTLYTREVNALPGTVNQIKVCTQELVDWARSRGAAVFLVAHVTKEGAIAGPKLVEHLVDTVVSFEQASAEIRTLQAVKNRFGSVDEIGFFRMTENGLEEVDDATSLFLTRREGGNPPGVAVAPVFEGSRVLLVEIQSLTVPAKSGISRIYSDRIDAGRVARMAAVLEKHLGLHLAEHDIYVNVAGGIRIAEVGVELPLALALYSARTGLCPPGRHRRHGRGEPHRRGPPGARASKNAPARAATWGSIPSSAPEEPARTGQRRVLSARWKWRAMRFESPSLPRRPVPERGFRGPPYKTCIRMASPSCASSFSNSGAGTGGLKR